jgi:MerC mercury resistance protein
MSPVSDAKNIPLLLAGYRGPAAPETTVLMPHPVTDSGAPPSTGSENHNEQRLWLDRVGIALSVLCAVHCALTPVLIAAAPLLFTADFEFRTKAILLSLAVVALGWGFVTHRTWKPLFWLAAALVAFGVAEWVGHGHTSEASASLLHQEGFEIAITVLASGALIMAHLANARACRAGAPHGH